MDHSDAVRLHAAEKYLLGELPATLRDEYEEHCFDCSECAADLQAGAVFVDAGREVSREERQFGKFKESLSPGLVGRWSWLRPVIALPALAVLLAIVAYQNFVTIRQMKQAAAQTATARELKSFSLLAAESRGERSQTVRVRPDEPFGLYLDIPPEKPFPSYLCQVEDESGRALLSVRVPAADANRTVQVFVPGGTLRPGKYSAVILGERQTEGAAAPSETARLPFTVEFLP